MLKVVGLINVVRRTLPRQVNSNLWLVEIFATSSHETINQQEKVYEYRCVMYFSDSDAEHKARKFYDSLEENMKLFIDGALEGVAPSPTTRGHYATIRLYYNKDRTVPV